MYRRSATVWVFCGAVVAALIGQVIAYHVATWEAETVVLLVTAVLAVLILVIALREKAAAEQRAAQARLSGEHLAMVLQAVQELWLQQRPAELLTIVAETARVVMDAACATAYLPDTEAQNMLSRIALVPSDALSSGPVYLPLTLSHQTIRELERGRIIVPIQGTNPAATGLLLVSAARVPLSHDRSRALAFLAMQAAHALDNVRRHEHILAQAAEDGLTGLLNHRAFQTRLEAEVARTQRNGRPLSVMMIDLDNFGAVNNTYGHQTGDTTLVVIAMALRRAMRDLDIVARYGGDEFAAILPETSIDEALVVGERVRAAVAELSAIDFGAPLMIDASIGVAQLPLHATTREELVRLADQAAYAAKHTGKGRVARPEQSLVTLDGQSDDLAMQLRNANMATVEALAAAVDAKDPYTRGHAQRVSTYAVALATALGLSADEIARVRLGGLLHDIGKIGVPDAVLTKAGPLTEAEYFSLQQHPVIGERMLSAVPFLHTITPAVRHHHERWDGKGYPDGLAGSRIPRDAAILMVADSFDAMTTSRPYRSALPLGEACRRIRDGSGTQFDPAVIAAFNTALATGTLVPLSSDSTKLLSDVLLPAQEARASSRIDKRERVVIPFTRHQAS